MREPQNKPNPYETIVLDHEPEQPAAPAPTPEPAPDERPAAGPRRARLGALLVGGAGALLALGLLMFLATGWPRVTSGASQVRPVVQVIATGPTAAHAATTAPAAAPTAAPAAAPTAGAVRPAAALAAAPSEPAARAIEIATLGSQWQFDRPALAATAGERIALTFANGSKERHNWVLVRGGDAAAARVSEAGAQAGVRSDYLPADRADIIAATGLVHGGAVTITFTAPAAGSYTYLCTVPGHYETGMAGTLAVR